eukprot:GHRR01017838.1.p1 GENE.GHRR01017838.1~~GHRR01017838.1.p1  ORF type:complete len:175 (+),score=66.63 GHRR01017838.1:385-909(+)
MVKKRVGGAHRYKALKQAADAAQQHHPGGPKPPQYLQRKITRKVKFLEKVAQSSTAAALKLQQKGVSKKRKKQQLPSLESLAGQIEEMTGQLNGQQQHQQDSKRPGRGKSSSIKRSKARLAVTVSETQRLQQVLQHPLYQADPIQAITNHLTNTMPPPPKLQPHFQQQNGKKKK